MAHNRFWLTEEARQALRGSTAQAIARLAGRVPEARKTRADLGMGSLGACWSMLSAPGQRSATG